MKNDFKISVYTMRDKDLFIIMSIRNQHRERWTFILVVPMKTKYVWVQLQQEVVLCRNYFFALSKI